MGAFFFFSDATPSPVSPARAWVLTGLASSPQQTSRMASALSVHQPRRIPLRWRRRQVTSDESTIGQPLAYDGPEHFDKAPAVVQPAPIEAQRLLVQIPEQVEWLDAHIGA